jgi:hypothetical protein
MIQCSTVFQPERNKLAVLLMLQLLWGLVLWFSISKYGVGISTDSIHMLFGGMNWWAGRGLTSYDGNFLILWPPLYPLLLGLVHGVSGLSMIASANVLQAMAYAGVSICLALLSVRIFPHRLTLAAAACLLSDIGVVVLTSFDTAGSDYLQLFLILLLVLLAGNYISIRSRLSYAGMAVVAMLAMLNRYLGLAVLATAILCVMAPAVGAIKKRVTNGAIMATTILPAAAWLRITSRLYSRRAPITFVENFDRFSQSILAWFIEPADPRHGLDREIVLLWIAVLGLILAVIMLRGRTSHDKGAPLKALRGGPSREPYLWTLLTFGAVYVIVLFAAASVAYSNKLAGRFLLPAYIPLIVLPVVVVDRALEAVQRGESRGMQGAIPVMGYGCLVAIAALLLGTTIPVAIESHRIGAVGGENAYNNAAWHNNQAMKYWLANTPTGKYRLISNEPDGVALFTGHRTDASPRKTSGPYGTQEYPLQSYTAKLFETAEPVYLVWIDPKACEYCYSVDELRLIATVEPLLEATDGGVYRLTPR